MAANEAAEAAPELLDLKSLDIEPNQCPLQSALSLKLSIVLGKELTDAYWDLSYIVDHTHARHVLQLTATEPASLAAGAQTVELSVDSIDLSLVDKRALNNVGMLVATLKQGEEELVCINMVTLINKQNGEYIRIVCSPLE